MYWHTLLSIREYATAGRFLFPGNPAVMWFPAGRFVHALVTKVPVQSVAGCSMLVAPLVHPLLCRTWQTHDGIRKWIAENVSDDVAVPVRIQYVGTNLAGG